MKRLFCIVLTLVFLALSCPSAFAVSEPDTPSRPSMESILENYHMQVQAREMAQRTSGGGIAPCSLPGEEADLTQQTVDALTAAGYEAYHVTGENYAALADSLSIDFAGMGLDPNYSYIVAFDGAPQTDTLPPDTGINPCVIDPPAEDDFDDGGNTGGNTITYNGVTYQLRHITVAAADDPDYMQTGLVPLNAVPSSPWDDISWYCTVGLMTEAFPGLSIMETIFDIAGLFSNTPDVYIHGTSGLTLYGSALWTRVFTQVWSEDNEEWVDAYSTAYARAASYVTGYVYNSALNQQEQVVGDESILYTYSALYNQRDTADQNAVEAYLNGVHPADSTGDISFMLTYQGESVLAFQLIDEFD